MHQCKRCGKDTDHYFICEDCVEELAGDPEVDPKAYSKKLDELWEKEEDAYYAAHGY